MFGNVGRREAIGVAVPKKAEYLSETIGRIVRKRFASTLQEQVAKCFEISA